MSARTFTEKQVLERLRDAIGRYGTTKAFAGDHDLSPQYVTDVLKGRRAPAGSICWALGIERVVIYRAIKP